MPNYTCRIFILKHYLRGSLLLTAESAEIAEKKAGPRIHTDLHGSERMKNTADLC